MMSAQPLEPRLARLEGVVEQMDNRLGDLAATMSAGFAQMDGRLGRLETHVDGLQWRMASLILGTWVTTMLAVLGLFLKR